jgi:dTDP-4-dehydrorhamnose reductase
MKLLLLGKHGQVGWELQRALAPLGELIALDRCGPGTTVDLKDFPALRALVQKVRPDAIVNAAAYTAVDRAETEPGLAQAINADAPGVLAQEAAALGSTLVHYSTDYVFDGSGTHARREDDITGPLNAYGRSKMDGEQAVRASGCRHLILRTSWVYGTRGDNFPRTMLKLAAERERLKVVVDQVGAPTGADLLADVTAHALRRLSTQPALAGTYHAVAAGETTWHEYACRVIDAARRCGRKLRATSIEPVPSSAFLTPARRPLNSRLDTSKLRDAFELRMPSWQEGVDRMLEELFAD